MDSATGQENPFVYGNAYWFNTNYINYVGTAICFAVAVEHPGAATNYRITRRFIAPNRFR